MTKIVETQKLDISAQFDFMKSRLVFAAMVLLAGCASAPGKRLNDGQASGNFNRDVSECEREAALAHAGEKAKIFDNCMKSKQRR